MPKKDKPVPKHPSENSKAALLLIDVISDFEFDDGEDLLKHTLPMARRLSKLKERVKDAGIPAIYVNDNFGKWQEDFRSMAESFSRPDAKGRKVIELLQPERDDYYILKPHRSAFYSTSLMLLLANLGIRKLIVTGITTDICILFTANDAYMRGFDLHVPRDCVAAVKPAYSKSSLEFIERVLKADTTPSDKLQLKNL